VSQVITNILKDNHIKNIYLLRTMYQAVMELI